MPTPAAIPNWQCQLEMAESALYVLEFPGVQGGLCLAAYHYREEGMHDPAEVAFREQLLSALGEVLRSGRIDVATLAEYAAIAPEDLHRISAGEAVGVSTEVLVRTLGAAGYLMKKVTGYF